MRPEFIHAEHVRHRQWPEKLICQNHNIDVRQLVECRTNVSMNASLAILNLDRIFRSANYFEQHKVQLIDESKTEERKK